MATNTGTIPQEAISCHNEMVLEISNTLSPVMRDKWKKLLSLFRNNPLTPVEIQTIESIQDLFDALMDKMSINYGNYNFFIRKVRLVNKRVVKIVKKFTTEIRALLGTDCGDDETPGPSCPKKRRVQESPDDHPGRRAMIRTTKNTIDRCTKEQFVQTKAFKDAKAKLLKRNIVIIKGNSGDGKTRTAQELIAWMWKGDNSASNMENKGYNKRPIHFHKLNNWDEIVEPDMNLCIFIDDMSADLINEIENRQESIKSLISGETNGDSNYLVITVRNDIFKSMSSNRIFVEENLIDTSLKKYHIKEEKRQILDLYLPKDVKFSDTEKSQIVESAPNIGFPQCCRLYKDVPELRTQGVEFFKNPYCFLKNAMLKLEYGRCAALLYLFLSDGWVWEKDLDPSSDKIDKTVVEEAFKVHLGEVKVVGQLSYGEKVQFIQKSLECLLGSLVTKQKRENNTSFTFSHDSVKDTVALLYNEATPIGFIQNCPFLFLRNIIQSENKTYQLMKHMYRRVLKDLERGKPECVASSDIWNDRQFVSGFFRWLDDEESDNKDFHLKCMTTDDYHKYYNHQGEILFPSFLIYVAHTNNLSLLNILLDRTPKDHLQLQCALFGLVTAGHTGVFGKMIEKCITPTVRRGYSFSSHFLVQNINILHEACLFERVEMVKMLATKYTCLVQETCGKKLSTLHVIVRTDNRSLYDIMETFLFGNLGRDERVKRLTDIVDDEGRTVLHYSCSLYCSYNKMVLHLLDKYPSLAKAKVGCKLPILHVAVWTGDSSLYDIIETSVFGDLGRDERVKRLSEMVDDEGRTVLRYSFSCYYSSNDSEIVLHLLDKYPSLVQATGGCKLPILHAAVETGDCSLYDKIEALMFGNLGRDERVKRLSEMVDDEGRTVLSYSCRFVWTSEEMVLHLLYKYPEWASIRDMNGCHFLHYIAESPYNDLLVDVDSYLKKYYNENGINYDITTILTNKGETVLDIAESRLGDRKSKEEMCNYLSQFWS